MKRCLIAATLLASVAHGTASAHDSHVEVDAATAIDIVHQALPQLAFKDLGFEVGKLDASWKEVGQDAVDVVREEHRLRIVSAENPELQQLIYFLIARDGQVMEVKDDDEF